MECDLNESSCIPSMISRIGAAYIGGNKNVKIVKDVKDDDVDEVVDLVYVIGTLVLFAMCCLVIVVMWIGKQWNIIYHLKVWLEYLEPVKDISNCISFPKEFPKELPKELQPKELSKDLCKDKDGCSVEPLDPRTPNAVQCYCPSTLAYLGTAPNLSTEEISSLVQSASHAQKSWRHTSFAARRRVLRTLQHYLVRHMDDICQLSSLDSGKTPIDALLGEILTTCEKLRTIITQGELWLQPSPRVVGPMMLHKRAHVEYVPAGVLAVIAPWNYPFHNMWNHVISGIFAGNAVITKVSEHTSFCSLFFHDICKAALRAHGHDDNLLQLITGGADAGKSLVQCPHVNKIFFTGSPAVGRHVMKAASFNLTPVVLELGGKDAMVFTEDVKLTDVLPWAMRGCFQNCGQNCCGVERLFVYQSILNPFLQLIVPKVKALRQGNPINHDNDNHDNDDNVVDCGAMVMQQQCHHIQMLIDDAVSKGAILHCGGKLPLTTKGQFYPPTVISNITNQMKIWTTEVFGPVMCIITVPDDDDDQCIRLVNDCPFGLGSSVYSSSTQRAYNIGRQFNTGMFTANDFGVNYLIQSLPFGGVKESGFGRFAGPEGLRGCCNERSIVTDRIPGVKTSIPPPIDYPMTKHKSMEFGKGLVELFYGEGYMKWKGIQKLIKNS